MPSDVVIRPAVLPGDAAGLSAIYRSSAAHHARLDPSRYRVPEQEPVVAHFVGLGDASADGVILVAEAAEALVGYVQIRRRPDPSPASMLRPIPSASVDVAVIPGRRGQGIGRSLLSAADEWAATHGLAVLVLDALMANTAALSFYDDCNYQPFGSLMEREVPVRRRSAFNGPLGAAGT